MQQNDDVDKVSSLEEVKSSIGMMIFFISIGMLFATLFLSYAIFRFNSSVWPPMGMKVNKLYPTVSTLMVLLSSVFFELFKKSYLFRNIDKVRSYYFLTILLCLGFFISQIQLWNKLNIDGMTVQSGVFPSLLFGITWIHAGHMVVGLMAILWLAPMAWKYSIETDIKKYRIRLLNVGKLWHYLGVIWLLVYIFIFII